MEKRATTPAGDWASRVLWLLITLALIGLALYVLYRVRHVVSLMFICGAIAYLLIPLADWLSRWRPPFVAPIFWRGLMSLVVVLGFIALVVLSTVAFITPFVQETRDFLNDLPRYEGRIQETLNEWQARYQQWYAGLPVQAQRWIDQQHAALLKSMEGTSASLQKGIQQLLQQTGHWVALLVELFLIPVVVFYLLFDSHRLKRETLRLIPPRYLRLTLHAMEETNRVMRGYIVGQLILGVIAGVATWIGLQLLGVKYAATLALFAGIARAIPVIGPVVAAVPIVIMAGLLGGLMLAVKATIFMTALFLIEHKMIMPKIIGDRVDLHPVLVIVVLLVSGSFFGLMGMFFGVPVAVILRNVVIEQRRRARRRPRVHRLVVLEAKETTGTGGQ
jgi:predicted PurR-regulated permease PerM